MDIFDKWMKNVDPFQVTMRQAFKAGMLAASDIARDLRVPEYTVYGGRSTAPSHIEIGMAIKAKIEEL